jgi:hypothetical protein
MRKLISLGVRRAVLLLYCRLGVDLAFIRKTITRERSYVDWINGAQIITSVGAGDRWSISVVGFRSCRRSACNELL